jgi:hypothetical protein
MPNYKSKMLTFLSIGEMTGLLLDNTDEDGILFAVATDSTNFKIVMWRKNSTATVDNETVYPANGPGRWHVLPVGELNVKEVLTISDDTLPGVIGSDVELIAQKKTNGQKVLKGKFNGVFEDFSFDNVAIYDDSLGSATPPSGMKMAVVNKTTGDELYVAKNNTWELLDIGGGDDTIAFADLPTGTTSNTVAIGNHSHTLDNLSDVIITSPASGQVVSFNGTNWINQTPVDPASNLDGLSDVVISSPVSGQTLSFDGTNWINSVASGGGGNPVEYIFDWNLPPSTPASLPVTPAPGKSIYYLASAGVASVHVSSAYLYVNSSWQCISASSVSISQVGGIEYSYDDLSVLWLNSSSYGLGDVVPFSDMQLALGPGFSCYSPPNIGYFSSTISGYHIYVYRQSDNAYVKIKPNISGQHLVIQGYYNESYFDFLFLSDCLGADYWRRIA